MSVLSRLLKVWTSILVLVFLGGCSSGFLVKTYSGPEVDADESAILTASEGFTITSVNGNEVNKYLLPDAAINYQLLPGVNTVVFTHQTIWARANSQRREKDEKNVDVVVTKPMQVSFNAVAGEVYVFRSPTPENRQEAVQLANNFEANLIDSSSRLVAKSTPYVRGDVQTQVAAAPVYVTPAAPVSQPVVAAPQVAAGQSAAESQGGNIAGATAVGAGAAAGTVASAGAIAATGASVAPPTPVVVATQPIDGGAPLLVASPAAQGGSLPAIEGLKVLWNSATTEEKKEFLKWAFK